MTNTGIGLGSPDTNPWLNDSQITTNFTYDIFGRITSRINDRSGVTTYSYYQNNMAGSHCRNKLQSIQITPALTDNDLNYTDSDSVTQTYTYTYDEKGDEASVEYQEGNSYSMEVAFTRDAYGRIISKASNGSVPVTQTFTYNNRNLLETAKSVDPTNTTSTLSEVTRTYDSFGNIKSETFDSGTVSSAISWNSSTKVMTETTTLPTGKNIVETAFSGLPEALEYDGTKLLQYNYGTGNVLTSIRKNFDLQDNHSAELSYTYNNWRKVSRRTEEFTAQNAPTVADYEYTYSKGLHLIGKQENEESRRTAYQYDSYYRLRRVDYDCDYDVSDPTCATGRNNVFKCNQSETDCEDFQLDGVHNIRASRENQTDFSWTVDGFNRLTQKSWNNDSITYTYDSNNNMTGEDLDGDQNADIVYTYDKLNRLTSVTNADYFVEYSYDPFNRRTEKTVYYTENSDTFERTHKYAYDGWDIISEEIKTVRTSDNPVTTTAWELRRYVDQGTDNHIIMDTVSCSDDGNGNCSPNESTLQRIWFHKDERGNIIAISDGNGTIYERYRYRVYGEHEVLNADFTPKSTAAASPFLWGGSLYEPETNLYWMRNRYYHIDMHRFINQDPIGIWGDANNLGNGFAYVAGMVIEASDPTGLQMMDPPTGISNLIYYTSYQYNIEAGKSPEIADRNASFARIGVSLYCSPTTNFFDAFDTMYDISQMMFDDIDMQQNIVEENPWYEVGTFTYEKENHKFNLNNEENSFRLISEGTMYVNEETGDELYLFEDGTIVVKSAKDNTISCSGPSCGDLGLHPSEPDSTDSVQTYFANQFIKKILEMHEKKSLFEMMEEEGPVIKYDDDGRKVFIFNPYYREKDPLKELFWKKQNADGTNGFVRNYFAPGAEYGYDSTTYEKFQQSGFPQTNVDPYSNLQQGNGFIQTNVDPYWY